VNREQLLALLARLRNSLWFLPTLLTFASIAAAAATLSLDRLIGAGAADTGIFFDAGAEGARGVLSTIAGSIITVTGVVFSVTIVALQLASSQFTPRVLRSFLEDRANQVVLGIFIATFTYALLVLRAVRASGDGIREFVPTVSVTIAVALALVSIGALIFFVNHITRSMQVETILERVSRDIAERVDVLFPLEMGRSAKEVGVDWHEPPGQPLILRASRAGYLQNVDEMKMLSVVEEKALFLRLRVKAGDFVLRDDPLAQVWPADHAEEGTAALLATFRVGGERTLLQDVQRGIIELTDVAVRALSPGINDPTTALTGIHRLTQVLQVIGRRRFPDPVRVDSAGEARILAEPRSFEDIVSYPYELLRHFGSGQPTIALALIESIRRVSEGIPTDRLRPLQTQLTQLIAAARRNLTDAEDLERVECAAQRTFDEFRVAQSAVAAHAG
jgi:uncharacterized membrane protein